VSREQAGRVIPHRAQELVQTRESHTGLALNARRSQHREVAFARERGRLCQQARLSDTRLAAQHERSAAALDPFEQRPQRRRLGIPAKERPGILTRRDEHDGTILPHAQLPREAIVYDRVRT
jgi:hypothetical protein